MQAYDLVVFDVDGTLLDTSEGLELAVQYTINHFGYKPLDTETIRTFVGPPIQNSFAKVYGLEGDILQEIATVFRNRYKEDDYLLKAEPYPGIYDVFEQIKKSGVKIGIATYKREDYARKLMYSFKFDQYTEYIYGADHFNKLKKKDIILKCIQDAGVEDLSRVLMVGDSDNDAIGAENIGVKFLGATYGFGFTSEEDVNQFPNVGFVQQAKDIVNFI